MSSGASSVKSVASIISQEFLGKVALDQIKPSVARAIPKEVVLWTPVVLHNNFPERAARLKLKYTAGQPLNKQDFPRGLKNMEGGLILNLPLTGIKDTLAQMIDLSHLRSDAELLDWMETWLERRRQVRRRVAEPRRSEIVSDILIKAFEDADEEEARAL